MLLVLLSVGVLALVGVVVPLLPAEWVVQAGWLCTAAGLMVGVPTGFWYHVKLRACLKRGDRLEERWWLRPSSLHCRLEPEERPSVLVWFALGGAGFVVTVAGCILIGAGVVLQGLRAGVF